MKLNSQGHFKIITARLSITLAAVAFATLPLSSNPAWADSVMVSYVDAAGKTQGPVNATVVDTVDTNWTSGWYVMTGSNTFTGPFTVSGDVQLILADGSNWRVDATGERHGAIVMASDSSLTIFGQSAGTGQLTAVGSYSSFTPSTSFPGIGSTPPSRCGEITINGGNITASGGTYSPGIGSGEFSHYGCTVTINRGQVNASGGKYGAGIGGGDQAVVGPVTINGGTVIANGGPWGAGIGSGGNGTISKVSVTGGDVTANGGDYGAGIGGGTRTGGGTVELLGGTIKATGGLQAAGVGGGASGAGATVSVSEASVIAIGGPAPTTGNSGPGIGAGSGGPATSGSLAMHSGELTIISGGTLPALRPAVTELPGIYTYWTNTVTSHPGGDGIGVPPGSEFVRDNSFRYIKIVTSYVLVIEAETGGEVIDVGGAYPAGTVVSIEASPKPGFKFAGWVATPSGQFSDASKATTTFTMPSRGATVTAKFLPTSGGPNLDTGGQVRTDRLVGLTLIWLSLVIVVISFRRQLRSWIT